MHLPYFTLPPLDLSAVGLGKLDWFAVFVFLAVVVGVAVYDRAIARGGNVDQATARMLPEVTIVLGFVGAHLMHVAAYHPELMRDDPWVLVKVWAGISSVGGFVGGALGAVLLLAWRRQPLLPYLDRLAVGVTAGWIFGRLGCATSHDHPGSHTDFPLGVAFPDGVRHDLGLYELIFTVLILLPTLLAVSRRAWRTGTLLGVWLVLYGAVRFFLDFWRALDLPFVDARYFGFTPAQYVSAVMVVVGVALLVGARAYAWPQQPALWGSLSCPPTKSPP